MSFYSKIAQVMMNLSPNFPLYNEIGFKQEDFKNPSFTSLSKRGKKYLKILKLAHSIYRMKTSG